MNDTTPLLLTVHEVARLLRMLPARVTRLAKHRDIPSVVLPDGEIRFCEDHLREWIEQHRRPVTAQMEDKEKSHE